jgi:hypothetical protein
MLRNNVILALVGIATIVLNLALPVSHPEAGQHHQGTDLDQGKIAGSKVSVIEMIEPSKHQAQKWLF